MPHLRKGFPSRQGDAEILQLLLPAVRPPARREQPRAASQRRRGPAQLPLHQVRPPRAGHRADGPADEILLVPLREALLEALQKGDVRSHSPLFSLPQLRHPCRSERGQRQTNDLLQPDLPREMVFLAQKKVKTREAKYEYKEETHMNRIYKVIWSKVKHQYVVVSELAHRDGKKSKGIGRSAAALLTVLALTAGIGVMPAQAIDEAELPEKAEEDVIYPEDSNIVTELSGMDHEGPIVIFGGGNKVENSTNIVNVGNGNVIQQSADSIAIGNNVKVHGKMYANGEWHDSYNVAIGMDIDLGTIGENSLLAGTSTVIGSKIAATGNTDSASIIGYNNSINYNSEGNQLFGNNITINKTDSSNNQTDLMGNIVIGDDVTIDTTHSGHNIAIGSGNIKDSESVIRIGTIQQDGVVASDDAVVIGPAVVNVVNSEGAALFGAYTRVADSRYSTNIGYYSRADNSPYATSLGYNTNIVDSKHAIAIGSNYSSSASDLHPENVDTSDYGIALGYNTRVLTAEKALALGYNSKVYTGSESLAIGSKATVGTSTNKNDIVGAMAIGSNSTVGNTASYSMALGYNSTISLAVANKDNDVYNSVALGSFSKVSGTQDLLKDYESKDEWDAVNDIAGVISVGNTSTDGYNKQATKRRIINVAKGRVDANSYDAVNGSQLRNYAFTSDNMAWVDTDNDGTNETLRATWKDQYGIGEDFQTDFKGIASQEWVKSQIDENAGGSWNVTTSGNPNDDESTAINKDNTVDFSGVKYDDTNSNIIVSQETQIDDTQNVTGTNLTFDLNDKVVLGNVPEAGAEDKRVTLDGIEGNISVGSGISLMYNGMAHIGAIQFNQDEQYTPSGEGQTEQHSSTITGLSNTYWDADDPNIGGGRAATEEQLKQAMNSVQTDIEASAYGGWSVSGGDSKFELVDKDHSKVHFDGTVRNEGQDTENQNIKVTQTSNADENGYDLTFDLNDKVVLGTGDDQIIIDATTGNGSLLIGGTSGVSISRSGENNGYILDGLSNITWDYTKYEAGDYKTSHKAATEAQLHGAFDYLNTKIDNLEVGGSVDTDDGNITVRPGDDQTQTGKGEGDYNLGLNDDVVLGGFNEAGEVDNTVEGSLTVVTGVDDDGNPTKVTINADKDGVATIDGLGNKTWDWNKYEQGDYKESGIGATEAQLHGAMEGTVQYDRVTDEDGNVTIDKTNITLNPEGDSVTIHNVAAGTADTDAVNVSQLNKAWDQINNNTTAITNIGNKVGELDSRIDEVGAGAAALAALHPLDFDPDDKWDFAAGYGNYRGENAVAIGAFYRPNEDTMFSVGGTVGNGDNMVNAGVSFKLGQGNGVSTSRVAMAKEIKDLRKELEAMKSAMLDVNAGRRLDTSKLQLFPDVPQNHWAYEYVATLAGNGVLEGYPDGNFDGARPMTRYEFAAMLYRAMLNGAKLSDKILTEFAPELERFTVDVVHTDSDGNPTVERVRVVKK